MTAESLTGDGRKFASDHVEGTEAKHNGCDEHSVSKTVVPPLPHFNVEEM